METTALGTGGTQEQSGYQQFVARLLADRDRLFEEVVEGKDLKQKLRHALLTLIGLSAAYGFAAGAYASFLQAVSSSFKLPILILATLAICFPAFYVVQILVGSQLRLAQVFVLVVIALALTSVLLAAFVPIAVFFMITGANYHFLQLLHVGFVLVAGLLGMYALHEGLAFACERHEVYPRKALTIMRVWAVLFAFVGIQMAWNLRPFLGDRGQPFQVLRDYEGNFYAAVIYSVNKLVQGSNQDVGSQTVGDHSAVLDSLLIRDSTR